MYLEVEKPSSLLDGGGGEARKRNEATATATALEELLEDFGLLKGGGRVGAFPLDLECTVMDCFVEWLP